ncbi:MAG: HD domain-containing protein [Chitinispirillales bacterium]|jgi:HD-GYP domain-containing protein (c-di-GMP phosphodiesterase class II)|nr:HD domain-containing protein [Chitinispirillales bacterium]
MTYNIYNLFVKNVKKSRYGYINILIVAAIILYGVYRCYEVRVTENFGEKVFTSVLLCSISAFFILTVQFFGLFAKWQPFMVSMVLFVSETLGSVIDGEFGLYFNILTLISIALAFYLDSENYLLYFLVSSAILAVLYFCNILHLHYKDGIIYSSSLTLAWVFYEIITFMIFILLNIACKSIHLSEKRDKVALNLLARAGELRDHETGNHLYRTTFYSEIIISDLIKKPKKHYLITEDEGTRIIDTVKLHDIGKIAVTDAVLLKPGSLSKEEFEIMKTHTIHGAKMLEEAVRIMDQQDELLATAYNIAYGHHEKWDGSGYPRGLSGFDIPLCARVASIADVFDALVTERPYKKAFSVREGFDILYKDSGSHFDPYLIEIVKRHEKDFIEILEKFR